MKQVVELRRNETAGARGSTIHVEIEVPDGLRYATAANLSILPGNDEGMVQQVAAMLSLDLDQTFEVVAMKPGKGEKSKIEKGCD